ncbi:M20/M25/M40 family metallo-hydrolase [Nesterenkonia sp. YGD6]|uniref:M20/M25/M40 family metallo-hydrolase n=1 Tax=Nesterenkonia sp. YGD6 TaxID=2901231 RepID=UPI001F4CADF3|nr:M20/M25/M40 family metallo-hydrolase [Nesterenkonia sp. YGD6]MCH8563984.1 M20/M25/M40 family metallo-hydrolase [Nesterenkonia sp. YGD6]
MDNSSPTALLDLAGNRYDRTLELLERMVVTESPTGDAEGVTSVADQVRVLFTEHDAEVAVHEGEWGTHLVMDIPGAGERSEAAPVLFIGHSDTVWPTGTLEKMPFRIEAGIAHGPGIFDMKSGLLIMHQGLSVSTELGLSRPPVRVIVVGDEEIGSPSSRELLLASAEGVSAVLGFESPHPGGALKVGRLGSTRLRLQVTGRASHAALDPEGGVNAIEELVDQILALREIIGSAQDAAPGDVLCNVGTIAGGGKTNVVPAAASVEVGLRFRTPEVENQVLASISDLVPVRRDAQLQVQTLSQRPAWQADAADEELLAAVEAAAADAGLPTVGGRPAAGAGDTNFLGSLGLPTLDGLGPDGAGAHADHEQVRLESIPERIALLAALLARL